MKVPTEWKKRRKYKNTKKIRIVTVDEETENKGIISILLILAPEDITRRRKENENEADTVRDRRRRNKNCDDEYGCYAAADGVSYLLGCGLRVLCLCVGYTSVPSRWDARAVVICGWYLIFLRLLGDSTASTIFEYPVRLAVYTVFHTIFVIHK